MFRKKFLYVFVVVSMVLNLVPINFVSADWGNSALIENIVGSGAYNQKIKMNDSGVAFAIWKDNNKIYTNKYINGVWESITPVQISEDAYGTANLPDIEVDNLGNAFAVWGQNNAIYTNKYINGEWSSTTTKISEDIYGSTSEPKIAMDNSGNTVAVWLQYDTIYKVFTNKYINGEWSSTTTKISIDLDGSSSGLNLDMDDSGNAVAIWYQTDAAKKIYTNNYNTSTFWGSANLLATIPLSSIETDVSLDDSGNAMAVWNDDSYAVYASKFTNGGSWGPAEEISNGGFVGQQPKPKVAMNSGNAFVAWHNSVDTKIYASKYSNGSWVNKKEIAGSTTSLGAFHQISMDDSGNATVVWNNLSSFTSDIYTNIYSSGSWSGTYTAMTGDNNYSTQPDIGMDASGNIVIVWSSAADDRSSASIYSNSYINNTAPTLTSLSVTPSTDGTGNVSIVSTVDDADANELSIAYHYNSGACTSLPATTSTISSVTSANGTAVTSTGSYQVTTVTTTPGANIVTSTWDSLTDVPSADGTYCLYAYAYDGTVTSTMATTTVTLDNTAPSAASVSDFTITSTALTPAWDAVSGASTYTVSSTATTDVTTSSLSYPFTSLTPNTEYSFQLKSTDTYGNVSSYSTVTSSYTNPALPTSVTATANGQTAAIVSWSANSNPTGTTYVVGNDKSVNLNQTTTSTKVVVTGLTPNTSYYFKVKAISASADTSQDTAYTDYTPQITTTAQTQTVTMTLTATDAATSFQFANSTLAHTAEVNSIALNGDGALAASLTLHSNTVTVNLAAGQSQNVDLSGNGSNDTTVTMNSVSSENGANFTLSNIPQGTAGIFQTTPSVDTSSNTNTKAVTINNSALTTTNLNVKLNLNITKATLMAISNNPEFTDISFEPYQATKDWTLTPGNGNKVVYVKFRSADGGTIIYSATIELIGQSFADPNTIIPTVVDPSDCTLTREHAYKITNNNAVYYITTNCTKRAFTKSNIFFTYFDHWSDVAVTTPSKLTAIANDTLGFMPYGPKYDPQYGALVKTFTDPKVYLLLNNNKYWITNENVFNTLNYHWNWIEDVDQRLLDKYTTKTEITDTTTHPNYTLIKYENDPKVYRLEPDPTDQNKQVKKHIPDETTFNKLNFRFDRVVTVSDTETYTTGVELES